MIFSRPTAPRAYGTQVRPSPASSSVPSSRAPRPVSIPDARDAIATPLPPAQDPRARYDVEGAALLDDNSKSRRKGGGVRGFLARALLRLNWAIVSWILGAMRKRWFTTTLLLWILLREFFVPRGTPPSPGTSPLVPASSFEFRAPTSVPGGSTGPETFPFPDARDLVVVCGHAVFVGSDFTRADDEASWFLEEYQKTEGQGRALMAQMRAGVHAIASNPEALLVFSGGKTRLDAGSVGEAASYWLASRAARWFGFDVDDVERRAFTEDHARDSLENVLFSVARFRELTGKVPRNLTVVSYEFKRERFAREHRAALRWPEDRFAFVGTAAASPERETSSARSEVAVRAAFAKDPYACAGVLGKKRAGRDPFNVGQPYERTNPDLADLFRHCAATTFEGPLPW